MPSLKDLKNRIGSVKNTRKITKAMQMVAAAKLRRAQEAAEAARPYADRMAAVMAGKVEPSGSMAKGASLPVPTMTPAVMTRNRLSPTIRPEASSTPMRRPTSAKRVVEIHLS